ncbi:MAG TPA: hypothetical protein VFM25_04660 [Verrucomicrobiae bacterium]|nr:hypothetical protein [Verrucomicrobiae bacterium]
MALIQSVAVGNRVIDLYAFQGEVIDEKKWSSTHVSGSGGNYNVGSGQINPVTISSSTATHDQFFLRGEDGQEMAVELVNSGLALRKGHRISVAWGIIKGNERGQYIAAYNHNTGSLVKFDAAIRGLAIPKMSTAFTIALAISIFGICLYGFGIIFAAVLLFLRMAQKKRCMAAFLPAVDVVIAQIKNQK